MILHLHSAEFDDHRVIRINSDWIKWYVKYDANTTHVIVGDGYHSQDYPVECVPVIDTPEEIDQQWEGKEHAADTYGPAPRPTIL